MTTKTDEQEWGAELSRAIRLADEYAALLICNEGQELEPGRWKLTGDQVEYGSHLQAAFEHLKWRGFADVTPLNDGLIVDFTEHSARKPPTEVGGN